MYLDGIMDLGLKSVQFPINLSQDELGLTSRPSSHFRYTSSQTTRLIRYAVILVDLASYEVYSGTCTQWTEHALFIAAVHRRQRLYYLLAPLSSICLLNQIKEKMVRTDMRPKNATHDWPTQQEGGHSRPGIDYATDYAALCQQYFNQLEEIVEWFIAYLQGSSNINRQQQSLIDGERPLILSLQYGNARLKTQLDHAKLCFYVSQADSGRKQDVLDMLQKKCDQAQTQNKQLRVSLESIYQDIVGVREEIIESGMKPGAVYDSLSGIIDKVHRQGFGKISYDIDLDERNAPQEVIAELAGGDAQEVAPELSHGAQSGNVSGEEGWENAWEIPAECNLWASVCHITVLFFTSSVGYLFNYIVIIKCPSAFLPDTLQLWCESLLYQGSSTLSQPSRSVWSSIGDTNLLLRPKVIVRHLPES